MAKGQNGKSGGNGKPMQGVTVQDFNWGAIFTGSKEALIRAKLAPREFKPEKKYRLPLDYFERWKRMTYSGKGVPQGWDASIYRSMVGDREYGVYVEFDKMRELAVRDRMQDALSALEVLRGYLERIPPKFLSREVPAAIKRKE